MKFEDTEAEWTCGHVAGAVCKECHRLLIVKANQLVAEIDDLREQLERLELELRRR